MIQSRRYLFIIISLWLIVSTAGHAGHKHGVTKGPKVSKAPKATLKPKKPKAPMKTKAPNSEIGTLSPSYLDPDLAGGAPESEASRVSLISFLVVMLPMLQVRHIFN